MFGRVRTQYTYTISNNLVCLYVGYLGRSTRRMIIVKYAIGLLNSALRVYGTLYV